MVRLEEIVDDQRRPVEEHTRNFVWMRDKRISSHHAIEYHAWVRKSPCREGIWRYRACVRRVRRSQMRIHDVLKAH